MHEEILSRFHGLSEKEQICKQYYLAKQQEDQTVLQEFLRAQDPERLRALDIALPEFRSSDQFHLPELYLEDMMGDTRANVSVKKHDRYDPLYLHSHSFFELIYVVSGEAINTIGGKAIPMKTHDICIMAPNIHHTLSVFDDDTLVMNIIIKQSTFKETFLDSFTENSGLCSFFTRILYSNNPDSYVFFQTDGLQRLHHILELLILDFLDGQGNTYLVMENLLKAAFGILFRNQARMSISDYRYKTSTEILDILFYIQNNYRTATLDSLAKEFNYTPNYMSTFIKKHTGSSFLVILRDIRMKQACHLLRTSSMTIHEIAGMIGYSSVEFFMRTFKKQYGMTPTEYRRANLSH